MEILDNILKFLPEGTILSAGFEGANIVLYTDKKDFFLEGGELIREVVNNIKKRVELRADETILLSKEKTEEFIKKVIPKEAGIEQIIFDEKRSLVVIEAKKPGLGIGKEGKILKEIKENTLWIPFVRRCPAIKSQIIEGIRHVLYENSAYRRKFLDKIGKDIYKEWSAEKKDLWIRLTFLGGARQVGRSCLLLTTPDSKILLDCGIDVAANNSERFPFFNISEFDLKELDAVICSHPHLDHSGVIPYLYKLGYRGPVYMTEPARDISALLALDFIGVSYKKANQPLFSSSDVKEMVKHSITLNYNEVTDITPDIRITLYNAGHALGSAMVHLHIGNGLHNMLYTADFKYAKSRSLEAATTRFPRLETLIIESTYGGKDDVQPNRSECEAKMVEKIKETIARKGKVLLPVLGVGRSQEIMLVLEQAMREKKLPEVPVYIDGMVWDVTAIHTAYPDYLSNTVKSMIFRDQNPFVSKTFKRVGSGQERKQVLEGGPCIILATSGM
ncbi:MAG: beta-CASP ribonuclease aCPSF1, partial [Nanoarchaeota archaeon]|nr:beta-CASP ribonuclease aCPSF1 [Nanoarchaeota archaeon]